MQNDAVLVVNKKPKKFTYKEQKLVLAVIFLLPWFLGLLLFFVVPFFQSLIYSFQEVKAVSGGGLETTFIGFSNYIAAWQTHVSTLTSTTFKVELVNTFTNVLVNIPVMMIFSLFLAVVLNTKFKGRAIVRAIFFIPVILNSAAVANALTSGGSAMAGIFEMEQTVLFNLEAFLMRTGLPEVVIAFVVSLIDRIYDILTLSGVPILLFLSSIQSIPKHLYEAAKIEGATSYEMFWLITLPNVKPHIMTVAIYGLVDTFLTSSVASIITDELNKQSWGLSSAMSWMYVLAIMVVLVVFLFFSKIFKLGESHYEN